MSEFDAIELTRSIKALAEAIENGCERIAEAINEVDITLQKRTADEEIEPVSVQQLFDRVSSIGARALNGLMSEWEKKNPV